MVVPFWTEKCRIPIIHETNGIKRIKNLFEEWQKLKKNRNRKSETHRKKEDDFNEKLNTLFDIATPDALDIMTNEEDKTFLRLQRAPGRLGKIAPVRDMKLAAEEKASAERIKRTEERLERQKRYDEQYQLKRKREQETALLQSSDDQSPVEESPEKVNRRRRKNLINRELTGVLDNAALSCRQATDVLATTLKSSGQSVDDFNVNYSSVYRNRKKERSNYANSVKADFKPDPCLTLHWDGKQVEDIANPIKVQRISVVASGVTTNQHLATPKLTEESGREIAREVFAIAQAWAIISLIKAFSFDTTSVNTGPWNGAAVLLQEMIGRLILFLACRHHIFEIVLGELFDHFLGPSSGPDILLFKRFQKKWREGGIDKANYRTGIQDEEVKTALGNRAQDIIEFARAQINEKQPREDYEELLVLCIIFLGGTPPKGVKFRAPGAFHRARWMAKAIYALKMWMFAPQINLLPREEKGLRKLCVFIVGYYIQPWFSARNAVSAPRNDIIFLQSLNSYISLDRTAANLALRKFGNHLWYLSEYLISFAFFDDKVSLEEKRLMCEALKSREGVNDPPRRLAYPHDLPVPITDLSVSCLVTKNSAKFFDILGISKDFLEQDPSTWNSLPDYVSAKKVVGTLGVVNDHAERDVKLMQTYNKKLTRKEDEFQDLLLEVSEVKKQKSKKK